MNSTKFLKVYDNLNSKFHYLGEIMDELIKKGAVEVKHEQDTTVTEPQVQTQPPADEPLQKDIPF